VGRLLAEIGRTVVAYVKGQFRISVILSLIYAVGFAICEVPGWLFVAFLCGFLNLIPFLGGLIGMGIALFLTWLDDGGVYRLSGVLAVWIVAQGLEGFWITPKILGQRLSLKPLAVFFAVLVGGSLFGPVGVLFAAPVLAVAMVVWRFFAVANVPGGRDPSAPPQSD
jgi:predicted PurR-regulated permease PerM